MQNPSFLLYGANGYTAGLIIRMAKEYGVTPILAGRNEASIQALAAQYSLEYRIASLDRREDVDALLKGISVVLHAAGPFQHTALPMMEGCLRNGTHYLDITGEIAVFELGKRMHQRALDAGILIMPGVGFDVVPTDCMALFVKIIYQMLPTSNLPSQHWVVCCLMELPLPWLKIWVEPGQSG